ncbi:MAG: hypothetical protein ACKVY0_15835 [Prosthecobacter sp.]|uniref:hypothetical protein n=1 Tax=Prosthecobacter sp. TaxID=1965333 RepID=UPI00390360A9
MAFLPFIGTHRSTICEPHPEYFHITVRKIPPVRHRVVAADVDIQRAIHAVPLLKLGEMPRSVGDLKKPVSQLQSLASRQPIEKVQHLLRNQQPVFAYDSNP